MVVEVMTGEVVDHLKLAAEQCLRLGKIQDVEKERVVAAKNSGLVCKAGCSRA